MNGSLLLLSFCVMGQVRGAEAPALIPPPQRIEARVLRTLSAPAEDPMHMPTDVAVDSRGRAFVADGANERVVRFNRQGQLEASIRAAGDLPLGNVIGLTVDVRDRVWLADNTNRLLIVLDAAGQLLERIDLPPPGGEHAFDATDVAVATDRDGRRDRAYIIDNDNHRVIIRDNTSGAFTVMGRYGRALGQFQWPFMVALGPGGDVFVSEAIGSRVQRITHDDRWGGLIGRWGIQLGELYRPKGVVVDARGRVYVSDSTLHVVQVFDDRGQLLGALTDTAGPEGQPLRFRHPMGMAFDPAGRLYVVELTAHRVAVVEFIAEDWLPAATQPVRDTDVESVE